MHYIKTCAFINSRNIFVKIYTECALCLGWRNIWSYSKKNWKHRQEKYAFKYHWL